MQRSPDDVDGMTYALESARHIHTQQPAETLIRDDVRHTPPPHTTNEETHHPTSHAIYQCSIDNMLYGSETTMICGGEASTLCGGAVSTLCGGAVSTLCGGGVNSMRWRRRLYAVEASTLCGGEVSTLCGGGASTVCGG
jgi:hypothetical protein